MHARNASAAVVSSARKVGSLPNSATLGGSRISDLRPPQGVCRRVRPTFIWQREQTWLPQLLLRAVAQKIGPRQNVLWLQVSKELNKLRHRACPSRLVTCADAGAVVSMEVLVEQKAVAPVRIVLKLAASPEDRAVSVRILQERSNQSIGKGVRYLKQSHLYSRACGEFYQERISIILIQHHQRTRDQHVNWHPNRPPPV